MLFFYFYSYFATVLNEHLESEVIRKLGQLALWPKENNEKSKQIIIKIINIPS